MMIVVIMIYYDDHDDYDMFGYVMINYVDAVVLMVMMTVIQVDLWTISWVCTPLSTHNLFS